MYDFHTSFLDCELMICKNYSVFMCSKLFVRWQPKNLLLFLWQKSVTVKGTPGWNAETSVDKLTLLFCY
jgi:hypothetical protein